MKYYLGLDNGGTTTKAALFTTDGTEVAVASMDTAMLTPAPDFIERDMEEMWDANCAVIKAAMEKAGAAKEEIAGVGICGHGKGLYLWGKDDKPARNGIISTDNRAYAYLKQWRADGTEAKAFEKTCQHLMSGQPVALLAWLRDNEPTAYANIQWVFSCKDYVRFRLTGVPGAELTDISGTNLLNLHTRDYDDELLALFGLSDVREALAPLCKATEICGTVSAAAAEKCGLAEGTPVIGGMFDIDACALATGITDESNLCMIAGTWSINEYIRKAPVLDGSVLMNSLFALPEYYLIEESSPTSAGNNAWVIRELLPELAKELKAEGGSVYDAVNAAVASIPPEEFVPVFLPFILGSNVHPNAKGSFLGITANHTRAHLLRGVYEGIAFCHRYHAEKLKIARETPFRAVRLAGGAAKSKEWVQIFADVLQLPVESVEADETGALGCAVGVATAIGDAPSIEAAVETMCRIAPAVQPNPARKEVYDRKYALYCKAVESLDGFWGDMQAFIES